MAFSHYLPAVPLFSSNPTEMPMLLRPYLSYYSSLSLPLDRLSLAFPCNRTKPSIFSPFPKPTHRARAELQDSVGGFAASALTEFKHVLLPITDQNPYLSEGTRQAAATTTALAKKYGADITVVVIDEKPKESIPEHDTQLSSIRFHLQEGGFQEFKLMERLGEGKKPTAIIGEVADDLNLDLVVLSMEAIHSKHVDGNLLAEFIPCPVLLLPL
ncbi:cell wall integrity/stress response component [Tasmannia lanceolata]|uniref:cell wall integrity/stress response component n=1 Tax=Tasmannia lanceolata TaxID=3420 RepID=UPI00406386CB